MMMMMMMMMMLVQETKESRIPTKQLAPPFKQHGIFQECCEGGFCG